MGVIGLGSKSCYTNRSNPVAIPPNPSPEKWVLLELRTFAHAYVMKVRYEGCTNYEGVKVMVYRGAYSSRWYLDPHFTPDADSPVARFRPDAEGWRMALDLAKSLGGP